jgi:T6SS immunity protein Tdi1, C-terminal
MELYKLISPEKIDSLGCWEGNTRQFNEVVGYSLLGHVFLFATESNEYAVLHPFKQALKNYGEFENVQNFEAQILKDDGFIEFVFEPVHLKAVIDYVGPLGNDEVYYPCPYPMVGGSCEPYTYSKGNVWVFLELVGQTHGI